MPSIDPTRSLSADTESVATASAGVGSTHPPPEPPPDPFPGYVIEGPLGRGGMGVVYKARQITLNRPVALKMIAASGPRPQPHELTRFLAEAEAVAAVAHPNVVRVYESGLHDGRPYLALEYLPGGTLATRLAAGRLPPDVGAQIVAKVARGVAAAHEAGIVHRDLKPTNVLFDADGEPKVTDFGLAKRGGGSGLTATEAVMGTPAYMAPEQARGASKFVGPAADVHALGALLYLCLTGEKPFRADDPIALLRAVAERPPVPPRQLVPALPRDLELICLKCLAKAPHERYPTAADLADELERHLAGQPVRVRPARATERVWKWARRNPVVAGLATAVFLVGAVGLVGVTWGLLRAQARGVELAMANGELGQANQELTSTNDRLAQALRDLEAAKAVADRRAGEAEASGYVSDVALAHRLWQSNDLVGMGAALDRCPPARRGWEWGYLNRLRRSVRDVIPLKSVPVNLQYSPDGKLIAVLTLAGLQMHDRETGREVPPPKGPAIGTALAFRPDGAELAWVTAERTVRVSEPRTGQTVRDHAVPKGGLLVGLRYAADGHLRAVLATDRPGRHELAVHDLTTGRPVADPVGFDSHPDLAQLVTNAALSPDGSRLAAIAIVSGTRALRPRPEADRAARPTLRVWEVETGKLLAEAEAGGNVLIAAEFRPDGKAVLFGRGSQVVELEPGSEAPPRVFPGSGMEVVGVGYTPDGRPLAGTDDRAVRTYDRDRGAAGQVFRGASGAVLRVAAAPDGSEVAAAVGTLYGPSTSALVRWDAHPADAATISVGGTDRLTACVAVDAAGRSAAVVDGPPAVARAPAFRVLVKDLVAGSARVLPAAPGAHPCTAAFLPDGTVAVGNLPVRIELCGPEGGPAVPLPLPPGLHSATNPLIAADPTGKFLAAVWSERPIQPKGGRETPTLLHVLLWDVQRRQLIQFQTHDLTPRTIPKSGVTNIMLTALRFDPTGQRLAVAWYSQLDDAGAPTPPNGVVWVVRPTTGEVEFRGRASFPVHAVGFDPAGRPVAAGGSANEGRLVAWDVATGKEAWAIRGHTEPILGFGFGPGGRLATGAADQLVKVWDVAAGRELITLEGHARDVTLIQFTPDGRLISATGLDRLGQLQAPGGVPASFRRPAEVKMWVGGE